MTNFNCNINSLRDDYMQDSMLKEYGNTKMEKLISVVKKFTKREEKDK